jgi:hypothetical protein
MLTIWNGLPVDMFATILFLHMADISVEVSIRATHVLARHRLAISLAMAVGNKMLIYLY